MQLRRPVRHHSTDFLPTKKKRKKKRKETSFHTASDEINSKLSFYNSDMQY